MALLWSPGFYLIAWITFVDPTWSQINNANTLHYQLEEELPIGRPIGSIIRDAGLDSQYSSDVLQDLHFQFLTEPGIKVHIDYNTGVLTTNGRVDRESITGCSKHKHCEVILDIAIQPIAYFQIYKIIIDILDINDNPPVFDQKVYEHSLKESASLASSFIVPSAMDLDSPPNGVQTYELHSDMNLEPFALEVTEKQDGTLGLRIKLIEALDREHQDQYTLSLMAYDGGEPMRSASINIMVDVEDSNDNDPVFRNSTYTVSVPENVPVQSTIIQVQAVDRDIGDNGRVQYTFSPQTASFYGHIFGIDPDTGSIFLISEIDHEEVKLYNLIVTAQDLGPDSQPTDSSVIIHIEDVNDNAPTIIVNTLSASSTNRAEIPEDSPIGTFVAHVTISDPDSGANGEYNCSLTDRAFRLEATEYVTEYQIFTSVRLDREITPQFNLALMCVDHGRYPQRAIQDIFIDIVDVNDHAPEFAQSSYTASIIENNYYGVTILQVRATDEDAGKNAEIRYELSSNVADTFQIEHGSGIISAKTRIDRETMSQYRFDVMASDNGEPSLSATVSVIILVEDVNDEKPEFSEPDYKFRVRENLEPGSLVGTVTATDMDSPPYNAFFYSFVQGTTSVHSFMIDSRSGRILTRQRLDREDVSEYNVIVVAKDSSDPIRLSSSVTVRVEVGDDNDNSPVFDYPLPHNHTINMSNKVPVGYNITQVRAHDRDIGPNHEISFEIHSGNQDDLFSIDHKTGVLYTNVLLSHMPYKLSRIRILARDHGKLPNVQLADLNIVVNQSIPYYPPGALSGSILSNHNLMIVISVACGCAVVAVILIIAIVCIHRQDKKQRMRQYNCRIEAIGRLTTKDGLAQDDNCHEDIEKKPLEKDFKGGVLGGTAAPDLTVTTLAETDPTPELLHTVTRPAPVTRPTPSPSPTGPPTTTKVPPAMGPLELCAAESVSSQSSDHSNSADSGRGASEEGGDRKHRVNNPHDCSSPQPAPAEAVYYPGGGDDRSPSSPHYPLHYNPGYSSLKAHSAAQSYPTYPSHNPSYNTFSPKTSTGHRRQDSTSFTSSAHPPSHSRLQISNNHHGNRGTSPAPSSSPIGRRNLHVRFPPDGHISTDTIPCGRQKDQSSNNGVLV